MTAGNIEFGSEISKMFCHRVEMMTINRAAKDPDEWEDETYDLDDDNGHERTPSVLR